MVGTWDGTTNADGIRLYVDATDRAQATMTSAELKAVYSNLFIGRDEANGRYFDGIIDEVGFWNRSLSQAEVTQLYNRWGMG